MTPNEQTPNPPIPDLASGPMPSQPRAGNMAAIGSLFERYSGKKFGIFLIGIASVFMLLGFYLELAGDQYKMDDVVDLLMVAMGSIALICLGAAVSVGICDRRKNTSP